MYRRALLLFWLFLEKKVVRLTFFMIVHGDVLR